MSRPVAALTVFALLAHCCGCASKFTRENFNAIRVASDTRETVFEKLGEPQSKMGGDDTWYYEHEDRHDGAMIQFDDLSGKVTGKQWMDSPSQGGVETPTIWKQLGVK